MMRKAIRYVIDLLLYCGLTKDEYTLVKKDAYASNFHLWKLMSAVIFFTFSAFCIGRIRARGIDISTPPLLCLIGYSALCCVLFQFVVKKDSLAGQLIIYGSMILLLTFAMHLSLAAPEMVAAAYVVLLVLLPMVMIDRPYCMAGFLIISVAIYLLCMKGHEEPDAFHLDIVNCTCFGLLGIGINMFYVTLRMRHFVLLRRVDAQMEEQRETAEETGKLNEVLRKTCEGLIEVMGDVVESRDLESGEHINRVKGYTSILASRVMKDLPEYGLDQYKVDLITSASALHDVGKITIPDSILNKPGRLTEEEFDIMKAHCLSGCRILEKMRDKWSSDYYRVGLSICRSHHEKWDGRGYPDGLKGDEIPIEAQIVSIADIFDALTSKRVYKEAYCPEKAFSMIFRGDCGAFSPGMLKCLDACRDAFIAHHDHPEAWCPPDRPFELVNRSKPGESFVLGFHDQDKTLRESVQLHEELSVLESLSEELLYVCYVDMVSNEVLRFRADRRVSGILEEHREEQSNLRFDAMLNAIILKEDYGAFRAATDRDTAVDLLARSGHVSCDFRVRLSDGLHFCRMKISPDRKNKNAVIIGISIRDEEHAREEEYYRLQQELATTRTEMENREKLADRLAVIDCLSGDYDYVCSLNAKTMEVTVYRAADWIRSMFANLEDIVVSPQVRSDTLKNIIHPDDFIRFNEQSRHESVLAGLRNDGVYTVNYRAWKYGNLVNYQTRYALDTNDPTRIIIGLRCSDR